MSVNEAAIREVVTSIEIDPSSWNMSDWGRQTACGTMYCLAGHAIKNAELNVRFSDNHKMLTVDDARATGFHPAVVAKDLLGLTDDQADALFYYTKHCVDCDRDSRNCFCEYEDRTFRHPTIDEIKVEITRVTGVTFKEID